MCFQTGLLIGLLLLTACQKSPEQNQNASGEAKRYPLKGKIVAVDRTQKTATIAHDEVEGYMPAMTMDFPIKADWIWNELTKDAEIRAELVVSKDEFWLENVGIIAVPNPNQPAPTPNHYFAQIGKQVPAFTLINQDGKRISPKDFRGRTWAMTFIYTRSLPNYCIRMSTPFSDAVKQIADSDLKDKVRLLSISLEPTDTPAILKQYCLGYLRGIDEADFSIWQLVTGTEKEIKKITKFFGQRYKTDQTDKTQINHSMRTIVVGPNGKVRKIFAGSEWTVADLLKELQGASEL